MQVMWNISASISQRKVGMESSTCKYQPHLLVISKYKAKHQILRNHNLRLQNSDRDKNMVVCCSVGPVPDHGSWKIWVVGILMSIILAFWRNKWGPLLKLKDEVESVIDKVEMVADIVEKVAEQVEEVADDIGNHLPEGGLKDAVEFVEDIADHTADGARLAGEFIHKVEEVEEKVETWMEQSTSRDEEANNNNKNKNKNKKKKKRKKKRKKEEEKEEEDEEEQEGEKEEEGQI